MPALHDMQHALGWLPDWAIEIVGAHVRVPKSEAYGIASSFPDFALRAPGVHTLRVCMGASCRLAGAGAVLEQLRSAGVDAGHADCLFICGVGPVAEVDSRLVGRATSQRIRSALQPSMNGEIAPASNVLSSLVIQDATCSRAVANEARASGRRVGCAGNCWQAPASSGDGITWRGPAGDTWTRPGEVRVLRNVGIVDPLEPPADGYLALDRALSLGSNAAWQLVKDSGLRGRGGAYFPVGAKWETARNTPAERKYLLVNAEEGEPGIYKDRHLLEGDPHRVVEGAHIAALGIGATDIVIFVNGEARLGLERLLAAVAHARQLGGLEVSVEVRLGAGGYILGEETALINAIHGQRAEPLVRPPFPAVSGLFSSPTVINNAETLANLPDLVLNGADWFRSVGTEQTPGTKLVSLAGAVRRPGLYEAPLGISVGRILDEYGGGPTAELTAVLVGGPSGSILPASVLDTPFDVQPLQAVGGVIGAGGIVSLTADQCVVHAVRELVAYNQRESCGKCTPCREGTVRLLSLFDGLRQGQAHGATLDNLAELNDILQFASLCGLGQMTPNPVRALLRHFPNEVDAHRRGHCPVGVCMPRAVA